MSLTLVGKVDFILGFIPVLWSDSTFAGVDRVAYTSMVSTLIIGCEQSMFISLAVLSASLSSSASIPFRFDLF